MPKILFIYNEGSDGPSNTYLNMLQKTAEEKQVNVMTTSSLSAIETQINSIKAKNPDAELNFGVLIMQPFNQITMADVRGFFLRIGLEHDIDNVTGQADYMPATAQGIYNYITETYPDRGTYPIGVIGRGIVGRVLLEKLIGYGYTVVEINSATPEAARDELLKNCFVIVGLSSNNKIYTDENVWRIGAHHQFIDAGVNFKFEDQHNRIRCGGWTREVLFSRI